MSETYNIYCDESCHLEHDNQPILALGAVWCPRSTVKKISLAIRKYKSDFDANGELKWTKVSNSKQDFYLELVNYFFKNQFLHFRGLVVKDKAGLNHEHFNKGDHDTFYYKMYFSLLNKILDPTRNYFVYLDIKDTRSKERIKILQNILCNNFHDFTHEMIKNIQHIRSHESEILQLTDFLLGALSYRNRGLTENNAKLSVVQCIEEKIKQGLESSTSLLRRKFNIFIFRPQ